MHTKHYLYEIYLLLLTPIKRFIRIISTRIGVQAKHNYIIYLQNQQYKYTMII